MNRNIELMNEICEKFKNINSSIYRFINKTEDDYYFFEIYNRPVELVNAFKITNNSIGIPEGRIEVVYILDFGTSYEVKVGIANKVTESGINPEKVINNDKYLQYPISLPIVNEDGSAVNVFYIRVYEINTYIQDDVRANEIVEPNIPLVMRAIAKARNKESNISALQYLIDEIRKAAESGKTEYKIMINSVSEYEKFNTTNILWAVNHLEGNGYTVTAIPNTTSVDNKDTTIFISW